MANPEVGIRLSLQGAQQVEQSLRSVGGSFDTISRGATALRSTLGGLTGAFAGIVSVREFVQAADAVTQLNNQLKLATGSAAAASSAYKSLFTIAQQSRVSFTELGNTFAAISRAGADMGISQERLLKVTQSIGNAMTISGGSAAGMQAALVQLGQGLASGVLRGEELNSVMEQTPRLAQALAEGLGVSRGELRALGAQGALTSEQVIKALEVAGPQLMREVESAVITVSQAMTQLQNSATALAGTLDQSGISRALANDISTISDKLTGLKDAMANSQAAGDGLFKQLANASGFAVGTAAVGTLNAAANTLNWTINGLTGGFFDLNENVKLLPQSLMTNEQRAKALAGELKTAEADLATLQTRLAVVPDNIYLKSETYQAYLLVQQLRAAKQAQDQLAGGAGGGRGSVNPPTVGATNALNAKNDADVSALWGKLSTTPTAYLKAVQEINRLHEAGALVGKDYNAALAQAANLLPKAASAGKQHAQALTDAQKAAERGLKAFNDLTAKEGGFNVDFSETVRDLVAARDKGRISVEQYGTAITEYLKKQPGMVAMAKAEADAAAARTKNLDSLADQAKKLEEENAAFGLNAQALAALTAARELDRAAMLESQAAYEYAISLDGEAYDATMRLSKALRDKAANTLAAPGIEAAKDLEKANAKAAKESEKYWEDALMRAFESGKGFFQSLWDTIKNTLKTQVLTVMVRGVIGGISGGAAGLASAADGAAGMAGMGSPLGVASTLSNLWNVASSGANAASAVGIKVAQLAGQMGNTMVGQFAGGLLSTGSMANATAAAQAGGASFGGLIAGSVMNGLAGYGISAALSGGYKIKGLNVNAIAGIASMIPGVGPIAGLVGGLVNRAFGRGATQLTSSGTRGTFSGESFEGVNYANYKQEGGWFRSDKNWTETTAMAAEAAAAWGSTFAGVKGYMAGAASALGLATDKITGYTKAVDIAAGTTEEQLTAIFTGMADDMAALAVSDEAMKAMSGGLVASITASLDAELNKSSGMSAVIKKFAAALGLSIGSTTKLVASDAAVRQAVGEAYLKTFAKTGETASETLNRLATSLTTANRWLSVLGQRAYTVGVSGASAASALADAFGGLDNLTTSSQAFYETYYTDAEKVTQSQKDMVNALKLVNLTLPDTKDAFKALALGLDLNTESGRTAYAVLLAIAPEFAATANAIDAAAVNMAKSILTSVTGQSGMVPALKTAALSMGNLTGNTTELSDQLSYINAVMGDASSGVIVLQTSTTTLGTSLTASQVSANLLTGQMDALKDAADKAKINFAGLSAALATVDTATFVATITGVFENLAERIGGVIDSITAERVAVREAALQIINPTVKSKEAIQREIAGINTGLPSNAGVVGANAALSAADAKSLEASTALSLVKSQTVSTSALDAAASVLGAANSRVANANSAIAGYQATYGTRLHRYYEWGLQGYDGAGMRDSGERNNVLMGQETRLASQALPDAQAAYNQQLAAYNEDYLAYTNRVAASQSDLTAAAAAQATAQAAAKKAALDYANALQNFAIDASKNVTKLTRLREETVKYYEQQQALANLMATSAAGLRSTIADYKYSQLSEEAQAAELQAKFASAYSMALATSGDGETLAGYGDKINELLGPLIDKLGAVGKDNLIANYLAQAEEVAKLIDSATPVNYQKDSLDLLGSIDATLAALDESSKSAEQIIANAVKAGSDRTAAGLSAVIATLKGQVVPAFATGGAFTNGVVSRPTLFDMGMMGEAGDEGILPLANVGGRLGVHARVSGGNANAELVAEVRALRQEVSQLRAENRTGHATNAANTGKVAKILDRVSPDGNSLQMVVAA